MILSFHRITAYWLEQESEASWLAAREFLDGLRSSRASHSPLKGHVYGFYNPAELPAEAPGYAWLNQALHEFDKKSRSDPHDPFDAVPEFDPAQPVPERDPFPAFYWTTQSQGGRPQGLLEVLIGWDIVVFHQFVMSEAQAGKGPETLERLTETGWAFRHECPGALFTAEMVQLSHLAVADRSFWETEAKPFQLKSPAPVAFRSAGFVYEISLVIGQGSVAGRDHYRGRVLVERDAHAEQESQTPEACHLDTTGFITRLVTLMMNASKVSWERKQAEPQHKDVGGELRAGLRILDDLQRRRARVVPTPLTRSEIDRLQQIYRAARKNLEGVISLVETCRLNTQQFESFSRQLLHKHDPWAEDTRLRLQHIGKNLSVTQRTLQAQTQGLHEEISMFMAMGGRFAGDYAPELLRFPGSRAGMSGQAPSEGIIALVVGLPAGEVPPEIPPTLWWVRSGQAASGRDDVNGRIILRPEEISLDRRQDLINLYVEALEDCSPEGIGLLMNIICQPDGCLRLAGNRSNQSPTVPIGRLFTPGSSPEFQSAEENLLDLLKNSFSTTYAEISSELSQDAAGLFCLLWFLEALIRLLDKPPLHLAGVMNRYSGMKARLLLFAGFLHIVCDQKEEAKGYLRQAARSALIQQDFAWAYFAAQFFRQYEGRAATASSAPEPAHASSRRPRKQPWQELASDFLDVYDLRSAVGLARDNPSARKGRTPFTRPWGIRAWLWGLTILAGASLLAADGWLSKGSGPRQEAILLLTGVLAVLAAPAALGLGARRPAATVPANPLSPNSRGDHSGNYHLLHYRGDQHS